MTSTNKKLSCCHINTRSILAYNIESKSNQDKMDEIKQIFCLQHVYSVITVAETWLTVDTSSDDADLKVENYTFYFGVCYRSPGQTRDDQNVFCRLFENSIENVKLKCPDIKVLLGNFNDRCTDWNMPHTQSEIGDKLSTLLLQRNLYQIINEPTRYFSNQPAILDLIIPDCPHLILSSGASPPIANLDHCTVHCELNVQTYRPESYKRTVWDYKTANINALNEAMDSAPWNIPYTLYDDIINFTNLIILATCKEHIRCKNITIRTKDKPWMCNEVRFFLRKRDHCFKRFKRTLSTQDKFNFYLARREANMAIRNAKKRFETKVVDSISDPNLNIRIFLETLKTNPRYRRQVRTHDITFVGK